ncbi:MAG TPA: DUF4124 domain-containing protein [Steroidobacteraceae bacterium]|jgi:hypothetical protein|nr:DUF4124 domain-containing protein [Steroidobacteraceae bacterium]
MSTRAPRMAFGLMIGLAGLLPAGADAASSEKKSTAYRWIDEQGVLHYGDSIPPQYAEKEHAVLNNQGVVVGHTEAQKTPEQQAIEAKDYEATRKQQQHDNFLLTTYTSVKDIESLRDVRLDQLQGQRTAAEQYVENLRSRLVALQTRAKHFRPYNTRPDAHRMPDDLAEDIVHTLNEMRSQSNALSVKNEEVSAVRAQFDTDIDRYRALHEPRVKR